MPKWIVETPTSLWLAEGANAAEAIGAVRMFIGDDLAYAAPLPRLRYGQPREIHFPDDRWTREADDTELEPQRPASPGDFGDAPRHSE